MEGEHNLALGDGQMSISFSDGENTPPNFVTHRPNKNDRKDESEASVEHINIQQYISDQLQDFRAEMRKLMAFYSGKQKDELGDLKNSLQDMRESLTAQNEELKKKISALENQAKENRQYIIFLENTVEDLQTSSRKTNFEIKNVPKKVNETKQDLIDMVKCLSETVDCKLNSFEIKDIYRIKPKKPDQNNTPIIVETTSALLKMDLLKMVKSFNIRNKTKLCAKHLGFKTQEDTPVYLSEHLTPKGSRLHYLARDLAKSKGYKFCWTAYGKVYVRKDEHSPIVLIRSEDQVHNLLLKD